jgi:chemotaxis protein MotB
MENSSEKILRTHYNRATGDSTRARISRFDESLDSDTNWLISFSDILSLLLVFFIMFLVMTKGSGANESVRPVEDQEQVIPAVDLNPAVAIVEEKIRDEITTGIKDLDLGDDISLHSSNREIIVTIKEKITFKPGEAEILNSFGPVLDKLAYTIRKHPHLHVDIIGHTDNVPIHTYRYPSNWELSVARAATVLKYFMNVHALDPSRLSIKGNADQRPLAPNDSQENRARNRRVEIRLKHVEA